MIQVENIFHMYKTEPPNRYPPTFEQTSTLTQGRFFRQIQPRGTPNSKPKTDHRGKTLCSVKYPDGLLNLIKFFMGSAGPQFACTE